MKYSIEELRAHLKEYCSCQRWPEFVEVLDLLEEVEKLATEVQRYEFMLWKPLSQQTDLWKQASAFLDKLEKETR